jgi:hypothetical protein
MLPPFLDTIGCFPNFSAPRTPQVQLWFTGSAGQGNLPTAAKWFQPGWEFFLVIYPGSTPVAMPLLLWRTCPRVTNSPY